MSSASVTSTNSISRSAAIFLGYTRGLNLSILLLVTLMISSLALQLISPQIVGAFIDKVTTLGHDAPLSRLYGIAALYLGAICGAEALKLAGAYIGSRIGWETTNRMRSDVINHFIRLDMKYHNSINPGEAIERIDGDISTLSIFFSKSLFLIAINSLLMIGIISAISLSNIFSGIVIVVYSILSILIIRLSRGKGVLHFGEERQAQSKLLGFIEDRTHGLQDILANSDGNRLLEQLDELSNNLSTAGIAVTKSIGKFSVIICNSVYLVGAGLALIIGVVEFKFLNQSIGKTLAIVQYALLMKGPVDVLSAEITNLFQASACLNRIAEIKSIPPERIENVLHPFPSSNPIGVEFKNVSFSYLEDNDRFAVKNLSFRIEAGKSMAVIGKTGSGKSTIGRLLTGLHQSNTGKIEVNGVDIAKLGLDALRPRVGLISQDVQIFTGTVRENLTLFQCEHDDEVLLAALKKAHLTKWFSKQDNGLDTVISASNSGLSAGESQLLALARMFLKDPDVLIMDEVSSRLDPITSINIHQSLDVFLNGMNGQARKTAIIIAHRLETISHVDKVLILNSGNLMEFGNREDLLNNSSSILSGLIKLNSPIFSDASDPGFVAH